MKKIVILILVCFNIGHTQTLSPKQELYDNLITGTSFIDQLNFLSFSSPVAFVPLSYDTTASHVLISAFYVLLKDVRTDYPYDYFIQIQLPNKKSGTSLNRYIKFVGFIWKIDETWVWVIEVDLHSVDMWKGVHQGKYRRSAQAWSH